MFLFHLNFRFSRNFKKYFQIFQIFHVIHFLLVTSPFNTSCRNFLFNRPHNHPNQDNGHKNERNIYNPLHVHKNFKRLHFNFNPKLIDGKISLSAYGRNSESIKTAAILDNDKKKILRALFRKLTFFIASFFEKFS